MALARAIGSHDDVQPRTELEIGFLENREIADVQAF